MLPGSTVTPLAAPDSRFVEVPLSEISEGVVVRFPVLDERDVLLIAPGVTITRNVIEKLKQRGISKVAVHSSEQRRMRTSPPHTPLLQTPPHPRLVPPRTAPQIISPPAPKLKVASSSARTAFDPEQRRRLVDNYEQSVQQVEQMFCSLREFGAAEHDVLEGVSEQYLTQMASDIDLFVSLGIAPGHDRYPARHSMQTAMLAMSICAQQALDKRNLIELGIGCMAHDAGMLHLDRPLFELKDRLDPITFLEITRHPTLTFDLMARIDNLAGCSRLVAYQIHERCDGSGYPRRRRMSQIHPLSRIAAVADVFIALISPRPHRPGMMPYYAMEHLLREAKRGVFDPVAVRALLNTVSLFPLGSFVELSDGRVGKVLRTSKEGYTRPLVAAWNRTCLEMPPVLIDLATTDEVSIARPVPDLRFNQPQMLEDNWD